MAICKGYNSYEPNPIAKFFVRILAWCLRELGYGPEMKTRHNCLVCDKKALEREICLGCRKAILAFRSLADASE